MIDFHTHTLFSDGDLLPSELIQRAKIKGYKAIGITDHVDESNIEDVVLKITKFSREINKLNEIYVIPGVEITHVTIIFISNLVKKARKLGAKLVIVHGETIAEPVAKGTNMEALKSDIDILAHPGLISIDEVKLAKEKDIYLELTTRRGHSYTNGHVLKLSKKIGAKIVINNDAHLPEDLLPEEFIKKIALGSGMDNNDFQKALINASNLLKKIKNI
ncbi:histidinol phosphate phosphatase domain-containing protein [Candidatus Desantisbacteria bacterium]|nr:histidinol phosphate phosphatase domain-containing protein [Candidatus Desantisbacteria bacterium]